MSLLGSFMIPGVPFQISILALAAGALVAFSGFNIIGAQIAARGSPMAMAADALLVYFIVQMLEPMLSGVVGGAAA